MLESNEAVARSFALNGFATVADLADKQTVRELGSVYDEMLEGTVACPGTDRELGGLTRQIMMPHLHHELFASNAALGEAQRLARDLVHSDNPEFLFSMLIYKPAGHPHVTPWHQDMAYAGKPFTAAGTRWPGDVIAQFWLALDDVDENMGCMEFVPGAHTRPMPEHRVAAGDPDDDGRLLAIVNPESSLDLTSAVRCPIPAGSATVHSYATPHYTGPNASRTRGRRAYIFSFANMAALQDLKSRAQA